MEYITRPIAAPRMKTRLWFAIVLGDTRRKYARVRWKTEAERIIVPADMRAMTTMACLREKNECLLNHSWKSPLFVAPWHAQNSVAVPCTATSAR